MHAFARRWRDAHRGKWFTARKLSGFCLLMKRVVYERSAGWMSGLDWGCLMTMTSPSGRGGRDLSWRWRMICLCITLAAGRLWAMGSMPGSCSMRMRGGSRTSGG